MGLTSITEQHLGIIIYFFTGITYEFFETALHKSISGSHPKE